VASKHLILGTILAFMPSTLLIAHITIWPKESAPGARERYTMRVPNEKQVATVRIEGDFPAELNVYDFEFKPGWKIDFKKDDKGKIEKWLGEANSPNVLSRHGWSKEIIKPGDQITVIGYRAKNGSTTLRLQKVVLPDGQELDPNSLQDQ